MRQDLIALTEDDLITQSNRGIVKRQAQKDIENLTYEIEEWDDGTVVVTWSNGEDITLPADKTLLEVTQQTNLSADKLSRQVVRSVLAYQAWIMAQPQTEAEGDSPPQPAIWNPALITDEAIEAHYGNAKLNGIRREYNNGHVIELVRSIKPTARFHTASVTIRFLVPMDFRYTHCDCHETAPCRHVPMAIWAFRQLPENTISGFVETLKSTEIIPENLIADIRTCLLDFAELGLSGTSTNLLSRIEHLIKRCEQEGLMWHADILRDLLALHQQYHAQDARYSPLKLAEVLGELMVRLRAVEKPSDNVPALFVRGSKNDLQTKKGTSSLMGLGCGIDIHKKGVTLSAYMQDNGSGQVFAVQKYYADPDDNTTEPHSFENLGNRNAMKGTSFGAVGTQRLLIKGGNYLPNATFNPGRANVSANPQNYQWENLRAPLLMEDFAETLAHRNTQLPKSLRPRRIGEDFFVCPVKRVKVAGFDNFSQSIMAVVEDHNGQEALMSHPFTSRGKQGAEKLLWWLTNHPDEICFIAGEISVQQGGLIFAPIAVIFEVDNQRHSVQPWVDKYTGEQGEILEGGTGRQMLDPTHYYPSQVAEQLGEIFTLGLSRVDDAIIRQFEQVCQEGEQLGFNRLLQPILTLTQLFADKRIRRKWDWRIATDHAFDLLLLLHIARETTV